MDPVPQPRLGVLALGDGEVPSPAASGNGAVVSKLEIGDPTQVVKLLDLAGESVDLAAFRGTPTLVLFWSLGCGHCRRILDEIKTWEATPPEGAPKLFVVSSGDPERNRAMGPRSTGTFPSAKRSVLAARPRRCCSTPTATLHLPL
jgi:thiol-disulfide isomerase/thioredoxin